VSILSTSGNITIDSGTRGLVNGYGATTTIGATNSGSASGNITVLSDLHWDGSSVVNYKTTGDIVLNSKASNYGAAVGYGNHTFNGASSVSIGNSSSTQTLTVDAVGSIQGAFNVYSQYVLIHADTSLTTNRGASGGAGRNIGVLLKATDRIELQSGAKFTTNGSDIVFWSDSDNNGVGAQYLGGSNIIKSNGGRNSIAGGLDDGAVANTEFVGRTAGDGHPDNYAAGISGWGVNAGIEFLNSYQLLSGGGDIFIAGRGSAASGDDDMGISLRGGLIYSGSGKIAAYGKSPASCANNWHRGIHTGWSAQTHIISESSAQDAIYLYGNTASCDNGWSVYASAIQGADAYTNIVTPNGGGINVYGTQGNASYYAGDGENHQQSNILQLNYFNLVSNTGPITAHAVKATTSDRWNLRFATRGSARSNIGQISSAWDTGYAGYPTIASVASSSDVTLKADSLVPLYTTFNTTGNLNFIPNSTFETTEIMYFSSDWAVQFPKKVASFTLGAPGSGGATQTKAILDLMAISSVGPIKVYGKDIYFEGALSSDAPTGTGVLIKATGSITGLPSVTTQGSHAVFWTRAGSANSSGDEGEMTMTNSASITTNGGKIIMAGSTDQDSDGLPNGDIYGNGGVTLSLGTASAAAIAL
jgi:hypothetical protein